MATAIEIERDCHEAEGAAGVLVRLYEAPYSR